MSVDLIKRLCEMAIRPDRFTYTERERDLTDAAALIDQQSARIATLEQTLREIANADTVEWDDPTEFEAWAKSRARHSLAAERGDKS